MTYLDWEALDDLDDENFLSTRPFPWINPEGVLTEAGRAELYASMPDVSLFRRMFGVTRNYGQAPHDRYELLYREDLPLSPAWRAFLGELSGPRYAAFVRRMFRRDDFTIRFQWQYATRGCSVSPHCDGTRKIGSHLFYFNDADDWDPAWGGATLVLDDAGKIGYESAPGFEDFVREIPAQTTGNRSFLFERGDHAWHGVRPLACPESAMRRIFSAVIDRKPTLLERAKESLLTHLR